MHINIYTVFVQIKSVYIYRICPKEIKAQTFISFLVLLTQPLNKQVEGRWAKGKTGIELDKHRATHT